MSWVSQMHTQYDAAFFHLGCRWLVRNLVNPVTAKIYTLNKWKKKKKTDGWSIYPWTITLYKKASKTIFVSFFFSPQTRKASLELKFVLKPASGSTSLTDLWIFVTRTWPACAVGTRGGASGFSVWVTGWRLWFCPPLVLSLPCSQPLLKKDAQRRKGRCMAFWQAGYRTWWPSRMWPWSSRRRSGHCWTPLREHCTETWCGRTAGTWHPWGITLINPVWSPSWNKKTRWWQRSGEFSQAPVQIWTQYLKPNG